MDEAPDDFEALIADFCAVTGTSDHSTAGYYLEACNGNLDRAIDYFYSTAAPNAPHAPTNEAAIGGHGDLSVQGQAMGGGFSHAGNEDEDMMVRWPRDDHAD